MSNTKLNKIKQLLGLDVEAETVEIKLEQMKLENGAVLEAEAFEPGYPVFVVSEDEQIPVPVGEYELEGGSVLVVEEEGIIASIGEATTEESPAEEEVEAEMEAEVTPKKVVESIVKESHFSSEEFLTTLSENEDVLTKLADMVFSKLESKLSSYTIEAGEMETEELEAKLAEDVKLEEIKPRKHNPETIKEVKKEFNNKRPQTIKDRVLSKLSQ